MNIILISSQEDYDKLPDSFDVYTMLKIANTKERIVVTYKKNSKVVARV
jgi:hypothetical protein